MQNVKKQLLDLEIILEKKILESLEKFSMFRKPPIVAFVFLDGIKKDVEKLKEIKGRLRREDIQAVTVIDAQFILNLEKYLGYNGIVASADKLLKDTIKSKGLNVNLVTMGDLGEEICEKFKTMFEQTETLLEQLRSILKHI